MVLKFIPNGTVIEFPSWVAGPTPCENMTNKVVFPRDERSPHTRHGAISIHIDSYPYDVQALIGMMNK